MPEFEEARDLYTIELFKLHKLHVARAVFRLDSCLYCSAEWYQLMTPWNPPLVVPITENRPDQV